MHLRGANVAHWRHRHSPIWIACCSLPLICQGNRRRKIHTEDISHAMYAGLAVALPVQSSWVDRRIGPCLRRINQYLMVRSHRPSLKAPCRASTPGPRASAFSIRAILGANVMVRCSFLGSHRPLPGHVLGRTDQRYQQAGLARPLRWISHGVCPWRAEGHLELKK
jgi:hypothetical protein